MKKADFEKTIRRAVVAAVGLVFFGSTFVVGQTLKVMIFGEPVLPGPAESSLSFLPPPSQPPARKASNRGPASLPGQASEGSVAADYSREPTSHSSTQDFAASHEENTFVENFAEYLQTGTWPSGEPKSKNDNAANSQKDHNFVGGILGQGKASSAAANSDGTSGSSGSGSDSTTTVPTVTVQPPFFISTSAGGINGVVAGYKVSASAGSALSAVEGTTSGGYRVWLNEGAQTPLP